jgi:hypothetical protein
MDVKHDDSTERTDCDLINQLRIFAPASAGSYSSRAKLTLQCAKEMFPSLLSLVKLMKPEATTGKIWSINEFCDNQLPETKDNSQNNCEALGNLFTRHGSDKASTHSYHLVYGRLFQDVTKVKSILEIGLGTTNPQIVSHMGPGGIPGASVRAFRDAFPNAIIYGGDFDKHIFFTDNRIFANMYLDQTNVQSLTDFANRLPNDVLFDLVVDDGLHEPFANVNLLTCILPRVRYGGWIIIEDISASSVPIWQLIQSFIQPQYPCWLVKTPLAYLFIVCKKYRIVSN